MDIARFQQEIEEETLALRLREEKKLPGELYQPISYILSLGGKRVRPLLTLMACELFDGNTNDALPAAMAVEVFHNFSLLHDDIMDHAPIRRGKPSVHEKWNTNIAILSGDAMLVRSYQLLEPYRGEKGAALRNLFSKTAIQVCEGQQLDMNFETDPTVTLSRYMQMITLKTAVLLGAAMQMGAIVAGAAEQDAQHMYEFGKQLGIAFQLQDDYLDVYGNNSDFGKKSGGDIVANKKTFLVLKALEIANRYMKEELENWMHHPTTDEEAKVQAVKNIFDYLNIPALAAGKMQAHAQTAFHHLNQIPASEAKKQALENFATDLMNRIR